MAEAILYACKACSKCKVAQPLASFSKNKSRPDGLQVYCKACASKSSKAWSIANPEYQKDYWERYVRTGQLTPEQRKEAKARHLAKNPNARRHEYQRHREYYQQKALKWFRDNAARDNSRSSARRFKKLRGQAAWANQFFIDEAYDLARLRTRVTGFVWHVDHIVPIQSPIVCGLHVENNLAVIPASQNIAKGNRHWPDMP